MLRNFSASPRFSFITLGLAYLCSRFLLHYFFCFFSMSKAISIKCDLFLYFCLSSSSLSIHFISSVSIVALMGFFIFYVPVKQRMGVSSIPRDRYFTVF